MLVAPSGRYFPEILLHLNLKLLLKFVDIIIHIRIICFQPSSSNVNSQFSIINYQLNEVIVNVSVIVENNYQFSILNYQLNEVIVNVSVIVENNYQFSILNYQLSNVINYQFSILN